MNKNAYGSQISFSYHIGPYNLIRALIPPSKCFMVDIKTVIGNMLGWAVKSSCSAVLSRRDKFGNKQFNYNLFSIGPEMGFYLYLGDFCI